MLLRNAAAGSDDAALVDELAGRLGGHAVVVATEGVDDLRAALRRAAGDGAVPVVCGGDGSVSLAVGTARRAGLLDDLVLGIVPLGTGNDLAGSLGVPAGDPAAIAAVLRDGRPRALDLAAVDDGDLVVVNAVHVGVGVDAAERASALKDGLGALAYPLGAMLAAVAPEGLEVVVDVDGDQVAAGPVLAVVVANGTTIGGGHPVAPDARPDDGLLDVVVSRALGPVERTAYAVALARGTHGDRDDVTILRGRDVRVTCVDGDLAHNRDGELGDDPAPGHRYRVEPGAWRVLVPA